MDGWRGLLSHLPQVNTYRNEQFMTGTTVGFALCIPMADLHCHWTSRFSSPSSASASVNMLLRRAFGIL